MFLATARLQQESLFADGGPPGRCQPIDFAGMWGKHFQSEHSQLVIA